MWPFYSRAFTSDIGMAINDPIWFTVIAGYIPYTGQITQQELYYGFENYPP